MGENEPSLTEPSLTQLVGRKGKEDHFALSCLKMKERTAFQGVLPSPNSLLILF